MTIRSLEKRLDDLEGDTTHYKQGNLATWIASMESDMGDGIVDEEKRLYQYRGQLYQLPMEIVETLERQTEKQIL